MVHLRLAIAVLVPCGPQPRGARRESKRPWDRDAFNWDGAEEAKADLELTGQ